MSEDRSQSPTPRRRRRAREQGQVARSHDLVAAFGFVAAIGAIAVCGPALLREVTDLFRNYLQSASQGDPGQSVQAMQQVAFQMILHLLPLLTLICCGVLAAHLAQTGVLWLPHKVLPDIRHLNPSRGLERLSNPTQLGRLIFQTAKIVLIVVMAGSVIWSRLSDVVYLGASGTEALLPTSIRLICRIAIAIGLALMLFGTLDYAFQRWKHEQQLRMTPDELREEVKAIRGLGHGRRGTPDRE